MYLRLVDVLAGFLRDYIECQSYAKKLYQELKLGDVIETDKVVRKRLYCL